MEGDTLDYTGDFLGRGLALWHSGVHESGFNFAMDRWDLGDSVQARFPALGSDGRNPEGRIVERMAKRKQKLQPTWTDVKTKLAGFDRAALLGLIQSLYAYKENQTFLHARFGLAEDVLEPYKKTIDRWLWPDVLRNQDTSVSEAKRAISDYKKAVGDPEGIAAFVAMLAGIERSRCLSTHPSKVPLT